MDDSTFTALSLNFAINKLLGLSIVCNFISNTNHQKTVLGPVLVQVLPKCTMLSHFQGKPPHPTRWLVFSWLLSCIQTW